MSNLEEIKYIENNFMKELDKDMFYISEDDNNYYIMLRGNKDSSIKAIQKDKKMITFYKEGLKKIIEENNLKN